MSIQHLPHSTGPIINHIRGNEKLSLPAWVAAETLNPYLGDLAMGMNLSANSFKKTQKSIKIIH